MLNYFLIDKVHCSGLPITDNIFLWQVVVMARDESNYPLEGIEVYTAAVVKICINKH